MSSVIRVSRLGKIAAITAASGGSLYLFRDELKPYLGNYFKKTQSQPSDLSSGSGTTSSLGKQKLIDNLPEHVPYLLVGGGTASHSAMRAIRGHDPRAKVLIVGSENYGPYMRPALSKELWFTEQESRRKLDFKWWNGKAKSIFYEIDEFFLPLDKLVNRETGGVAMIKNMRLTRLDPDERLAYLENGQKIKYDKCLLAPGGKPKSLPELDRASEEVKKRVVYFRTADDFLRLDEIAGTAKSILVIGGGFLGSELTCALVNRNPDEKIHKDQKIYQIYPETGNLGKVLPQYLSEWVSKKIEQEGANIVPRVEVKNVSMSADKTIDVKLSNGQELKVDYIVCAVGLEPDVELAKSSGLEVDEKTGGYLVNSELEARTNVWVAGDASCFYDIKLGRRRVEHHDHAVNSGKLAGRNMVGAGNVYTHQSMLWSDLGRDISFEAVGIIDSTLPTVAVFAQPTSPTENSPHESSSEVNTVDSKVDNDPSNENEINTQNSNSTTTATKSNKNHVEKGSLEKETYDKGVVFYLKDGVIVGILLWNLFSRLTIARRLLNEQKRYDDFNEVAKMFNLYLDE
uniref:Apoptosis-inducing factor 1, mitochondrial n=1 Tax=Aceria tosichella TaxID=561515 RepID=A0A6G1S6S0_9ACAR